MNYDRFFSGNELKAYEYMGCHKLGNGVEFCLWAPHTKKVEVFTSKDGFKKFYPLSKVDKRGIWYGTIEDCECIYSYRYRIDDEYGNHLYKSDPFAFYGERRPANASVMYDLNYYHFSDDEYMKKRRFSYHDPLNIYEVHANGFKHDEYLSSYKQLKDELIPYVLQMGYTHIELMPIVEHPLDASWGYQATGFYAATSRYGTPWDLMDFINECHLNNIGVILDLAFVHFANDEHGLGNFDGKPCFEADDPYYAYSQWGSYKFDLRKSEVNSFLLSCADFYIGKYHIDGLRLDAVSNFIWYDGNRDYGDNHEGLQFIRNFNQLIKAEHPDVMIIAEDSSDFPHVTASVEEGGLGFDYKWDLGWMNDTLRYYALDPWQRQYNHNLLTFSMAYFYSEKFILPLSHDEVVHAKGTILNKMWGNYEEKFAQCRNLFLYMFSHPGKKLNFLGNDIAMFREFDEARQLDWDLLSFPAHDSFHRFFRDLCQIYKTYKAFNCFDYDEPYYKWIDADNYAQSIYIYTRYDDDYCFLIVLNMRPETYHNYRIGVPIKGEYSELINSEKDIYGGCNMCNYQPLLSEKISAHNLSNSISIEIAPYAGIIFCCRIDKKAPVAEDQQAEAFMAQRQL